MTGETDFYARITARAVRIKLVLTDVDGVLTDTGVYYSDAGEVLKRFSIRDGMGVERLRTVAGIRTGIVSGEDSPSIKKRAEKLGITEVHLGVKNKESIIPGICKENGIQPDEIAYIGDDVNDLAIMKVCGLCGCPADALPEVRKNADFVCTATGGNGAFREFADFILASQIGEHSQSHREDTT